MTYLHVTTGSQCPNRCLFCATGDIKSTLSYDEIINSIDQKIAGTTGVLLTGGEPSAHPDFIPIIKYIKETHDLKISIMTNSIPFANDELVNAAAQYIDRAECSFYSYAESLYTHLTQNKHAYQRTVAGIQNLIDSGVGVHVKTLVNLHPVYRTIDRTTRAIDTLFDIDKIIYSGVDVCGSVMMYPNIIIKLNRAAPYLTRALDVAIQRGITPHLMFYPLCLVVPHQRRFIVSEIENTSNKPYDNIHPRKCDRCSQTERCSGVWENYIKKYGDHELKPIEG